MYYTATPGIQVFIIAVWLKNDREEKLLSSKDFLHSNFSLYSFAKTVLAKKR